MSIKTTYSTLQFMPLALMFQTPADPSRVCELLHLQSLCFFLYSLSTAEDLIGVFIFIYLFFFIVLPLLKPTFFSFFFFTHILYNKAPRSYLLDFGPLDTILLFIASSVQQISSKQLFLFL